MFIRGWNLIYSEGVQKSLTWFLVVVAVGLFAFIFLFERKMPSTAEQAEARPLFPNLNGRNIEAVQITLNDGGIIRAEQTNDGWFLTKPFYAAEQSKVEDFLTNILALHKLDTIAPREVAAQGQKAFGLENPRAKIDVTGGTNQYHFEIGGPAPLTNNIYLRLQPSGEVVLAEGAIAQSLPRSTNDWRGRDLIGLSSFNFDHVQVRAGQRLFEIAKNPTNQLWQITKPIPARADQPRINDLLEKLRAAQVAQFVADTPGGDLDRYGLQSPELELAVLNGTNRLFAVEFGAAPTNQPARVYAELIGQTNVVLASRELEDYLKQPYKNFHDPRLVTFDPKHLDRILVHSVDNFVLQRQENGQWIADEKKMLPVDPELLRDFLNTVLSMRIIDIAKEVPSEADLKSLGLLNPIASYAFFERLTNSAGLLTNILFTDISFGTNQIDRIYVHRSDETPVYLTPLAPMLQLPRSAFELRDRQIWSFPETNIVKITLSNGKATNILARGPSGWTADAVANAAIDEAVYRLSKLRALSWVARGPEHLPAFAINDSSLRLELEVSGGAKPARHRIHFGRSTLRHDAYAATVLAGDTEPTILVFPGELYSSILQYFPVPKD